MKLSALELVSAWLHARLSQFPIISGASFSMCSSPPTLFPLLITIWRLALDAHRHFANARIFNYPSSDGHRVIFVRQLYIREWGLVRHCCQQWITTVTSLSCSSSNLCPLEQALLSLHKYCWIYVWCQLRTGNLSTVVLHRLRCISSVLFLCVQMENVTMEPAISEGLIWFLINENSVTFGMGYI